MKKIVITAALLAAACQGGGGDGTNNVAADTSGSAGGATGNQVGPAQAAQAKTSLLQALEGSADHKTLVNAVKAAGLTETLSGAQPYTLFAPGEAAFQKLPPGTLNDLLAPESKGRLVALLTGHIVPGVVTAEDLAKAIERGKGKAEIATVGGTRLRFSGSGEAIAVSSGAGPNGRLAAGSVHSNGVLHSVDTVLEPR